jgi:hypothetical protein
MEDDGPNFSYAYGGSPVTSPSAPSWNPALRPNHESSDNLTTAAPDQQPSPQIIPQSKPELDQGLDEEDELPTISATSAVPTHLSNGVPERESTSHDDFFARYGSDDTPQSAPSQPEAETNGHGVNGAEADELVNATQGLSLEHNTVEDAHTEANLLEHDEGEVESSIEAESSDDDPAQQYEHQGETTLLEDAVAESAKAPLIADAEPTTDDWGTSGEVFDLGGMPQDAPLETPLDAPFATQTEGGGTTVGDEVIRDSKAGGNAGEDIDWGTEEGDDFFGNIASQPAEPQPSTEQSPGAHVVPDATSQTTKGAGSVWDIPLDDDFLPDADNAPLFELDDDEGFLEDEPSEPAQPVQAVPTTSRYAPQTSQVQQPPAAAQFNNYAANNQQPAAAPSFPHGAYNQASPYMQQPPRPAMTSSAQSFADKAKGGYHSPYDLPDDVITTRRRPAHRTTSVPASQPTPPPPRTSSISNATATVPPTSNMSANSFSPPPSGHSMQPQVSGPPPNALPKPAAPGKTASSDFFADLPISTKPRTARQHTSHVAAQPPAAHGFPPKERTASWSSLRNEVRHEPENLVSQLQQPERLPVFPDQPTAPVRTNSLPVPQPPPAPASSRYSPAPAPSGPAANTRYSPAPPTANARYSPAPPPAQAGSSQGPYSSTPPSGPPRPPAQPYAPRTSSPLAFHSQPHPNDGSASTPEQSTSHVSNHHAMHSSEGVPGVPFRTPLEGVNENEEHASAQSSAPQMPVRSQTPPTRSIPSSAVSSPRKKGNYTPQYQPNQPALGLSAVPPPRAQSQSPSATMKQLGSASYERPASAHGGVSLPSTFGAPNFGAQPTTQNVNTIPHRRQMSLEYDCIAPMDERAADPLQRWKGAPVFTWGLGGTVVTTFPKQIPRYGGGATMPMMKCCPGEVRIQSVKDALPVSEDVAKFPGPLKAKGKKKDVLSWLSQRIEILENQLKTPGIEHSLPADELKRLEEKALLWKIVQVHVEHDGQLTGSPAAEAAVRQVLSPASDMPIEGEASFATAADLVGGHRSRSNTAVQADPVDPRAVEELRSLLTKGDREKAVWHAVDQRLWAHAMLLSSTLSKDVWKQVVQEFVRKEVKKMGRDNQALAVLYEVFAGNHEDCIDELVPASARAGFQMMSTDGAGATQNALQGLDKWQETLSLVLNNRSEGDAASLLSLGRLLAGYGRVEAAHICFVFARSMAIFSGVDDPQADIVLIGADHRQNSLELGVDLEPVLLTEVYEFGLSLSAQGGSYIIPHLQNYKLAHAYRLAEYGHRADAQAYCDAIAAAMKATTRVSPYYNGSFVATLDDLSKRLSQSPKDGSSSWISKPSMDKVSSSLLSKFNNFIAGDNDDPASSSGNGHEVGPFAKIAGDSPTLSPTASNADLYGAMTGQIAPSAPATGSSRYAPSNVYAPRASLESTRQYASQGRPSMESDGGMRTFSDTYLPSPTMSGPYTPSQPQFSPSGLQPQLNKSHSYSPLRTEHNAPQPSYGSPYQPSPVTEEPAPSFGGYQPSTSFDEPHSASAQPSSSYEPSSSTYQPPTSSYEPPAFEPYKPEDEEDEKASLKPKKSFMDLDDDDDLVTRAASLKSKGKSDSDKKADEAFRKAAEEDAQRDKDGGGQKKGWFGWFKKDPNAPPGPIKAKLGEENSMYYDEDLKRWVSKKGGAAEATRPMATPPPPRSGPPSRAVSGNGGMGPPSSLPGASHLSAPPTRAPTSNPQRSSSMPPPMGLPPSRSSTPGLPSDGEGGSKPPVLRPPMLAAGSGPPSRPGTGMSTASSIDDLLGAPQARKGPAAKKKKGGRYVDVMAQN